MKKILLLFCLNIVALNFTYAQWSPSTGSGPIYYNAGNVGIGTSTPRQPLEVNGSVVTTSNGTTNFASAGLFDYNTGDLSTRIITRGNNTTTPGNFKLYTQSSDASISNLLFTILGNGNTGIGIATPASLLHVNGNGSSANATSQYSGNLIIQGNSGDRSTTSGASLEFVIPADLASAGGNNPWGQARIITVAGNVNTSDATGKLILGTRRMFDKQTGTGTTWNYGNDIVIDGSGHVGIGTSTPDQMLTVLGTIHAKQINVDISVPGPDYVFNKDYKLKTLNEVNKYIAKNKHLPEVPSAKVMGHDGINVSDLNMKLLQKVEELTLYLIEKDKQVVALQKANQQQVQTNQMQQDQITLLKQQVEAIAKKLK